MLSSCHLTVKVSPPLAVVAPVGAVIYNTPGQHQTSLDDDNETYIWPGKNSGDGSENDSTLDEHFKEAKVVV